MAFISWYWSSFCECKQGNVSEEFLVDSNNNEVVKTVVSSTTQMCSLLGIEQNLPISQAVTIPAEPIEETRGLSSNSAPSDGDCQFDGNDIPKTGFANWNNIFSTPHRMQLSVRSFLSASSIHKTFQNCKTNSLLQALFSCIPLFIHTFKSSPDFTGPLWLLTCRKLEWLFTVRRKHPDTLWRHYYATLKRKWAYDANCWCVYCGQWKLSSSVASQNWITIRA